MSQMNQTSHVARGDSSLSASLSVPGCSALFIGVYPAGFVYADRNQDEDGDYKDIAFLPYDTLVLEVRDAASPLLPAVKEHVAWVQARRGELFALSTCGRADVAAGLASGQTVTLGSAGPSLPDSEEPVPPTLRFPAELRGLSIDEVADTFALAPETSRRLWHLMPEESEDEDVDRKACELAAHWSKLTIEEREDVIRAASLRKKG